MSDILIRKIGRAGRITLTRPKALNAVTYEMVTEIEKALEAWREDDGVALVVIDAEGDKAFSAGGDIADLYATGKAGDFGYGQKFWADEYRLNHKIATYSKPYIAFMQGFTMGGGVGISCHGSHRVVGESSQIAMPECGIGLVPDVGGSYILAKAQGRVGDYLGLTTSRMGADDAIFAGFADMFIPQTQWCDAIVMLETTGDPACLERFCSEPEQGELRLNCDEIDRLFAKGTLAEVYDRLLAYGGEFAAKEAKAMSRNSPVAMAVALETLEQLRAPEATITTALTLEYRFTARAMEFGDFLEGIRAAIIDKDRNPNWSDAIETLSQERVAQMLAPLPNGDLDLKET
jgi:enoyl-CoA hydratase/carnithine racemase